MNLKQCPNGHYYDADKFSRCPHCEAAGMNPIDGGQVPPPNPGVTVAFNPIPVSGDPIPTQTVSYPAQGNVPDCETTQPFRAPLSKDGTKPAVGWLVCTAGIHRGQEYRLTDGRNFIGRTPDNTVALEGEQTVSRNKHAVVVYEPTQNMFLAQPGESTELFYMNGSVVLNATPIHKNDKLTIGEVELMLIPCCDECFRWPNEKDSAKKEQ